VDEADHGLEERHKAKGDERSGGGDLPEWFVGWNAEAGDPERKIDKRNSRSAKEDEQDGDDCIVTVRGHGRSRFS
jgi:hypothetical protein